VAQVEQGLPVQAAEGRGGAGGVEVAGQFRPAFFPGQAVEPGMAQAFGVGGIGVGLQELAHFLAAGAGKA